MSTPLNSAGRVAADSRSNRRCLLCGDSGQLLSCLEVKETETGELFSIVRCSKCDALRTEPVPDDLSGYYSSEIGEEMAETGSWLHACLKKLLFSIEFQNMRLESNSEPTIVDIGCGSGSFSRYLHDRGCKVVSADLHSERPLQLRDFTKIEYRGIDSVSPRIEAPSGALAVMRHTLEHIKDPVRFIRSLKDCGIRQFYIAVPNSDCADSRFFKQYWYLWDPPRHLWHFDLKSLTVMAGQCGLRIRKSGFYTIPTIVPNIYRYLKLRNAPAAICSHFRSKGFLSTLLSPLNIFFGRNVVWITAEADEKK